MCVYPKVPFPVGSDGEADVFVLLERKDEMEALVQVSARWLSLAPSRSDPCPLRSGRCGEPGYAAIPAAVCIPRCRGGSDALSGLSDQCAGPRACVYPPQVGIKGKAAFAASDLVCSRVLCDDAQELCHKYESEQRNLFHLLSGPVGIPLVAIPSTPCGPTSSGPKPAFRRRVLWLEVNKTAYSMSLLCLASAKRFRAAKAHKDWLTRDYDPAKYTVIPLCDVAEVRRGPCSKAFRAFPQQSLVDPRQCLVVVGAVGVMNLQLVAKSAVERDWLLDSLSMMGNNSLSHAEARLRGRRWRRYHNVKTLLPVPSNKKRLPVGRLREALKMKKLLLDVIDVSIDVFFVRLSADLFIRDRWRKKSVSSLGLLPPRWLSLLPSQSAFFGSTRQRGVCICPTTRA